MVSFGSMGGGGVGWNGGGRLRILRVVQAINRKYKIGMSCSERLYVYIDICI